MPSVCEWHLDHVGKQFRQISANPRTITQPCPEIVKLQRRKAQLIPTPPPPFWESFRPLGIFLVFANKFSYYSVIYFWR